MSGGQVGGRGERFTVGTIQEREEEKNGHPREQMQIDFPQEFLLVDPIPALYRHVIRVRPLDFCLFFFFGHSWRERKAGGGEGDVIHHYMRQRGLRQGNLQARTKS